MFILTSVFSVLKKDFLVGYIVFGGKIGMDACCRVRIMGIIDVGHAWFVFQLVLGACILRTLHNVKDEKSGESGGLNMGV